jgi:hypothetical protein
VVRGGGCAGFVTEASRKRARRSSRRASRASRRASAAAGSRQVSKHEVHAAFRGRWPIPYDFAADPEARAAVCASLAGFQPFEDRLNALGSVRDAALKRLLQTPAPDLPALALKIELAVDEEVATLAGGERCLAMLKADGWRLAATLG